jgi:hypothetical protein
VLLTLVLFTLRSVPLIHAYVQHAPSAFKKTAEELRVFYHELYEKLDQICLGEDICGKCEGKSCLVGYTKLMLGNAKDLKTVDLDYVKDVNHQKNFPKDQLLESLVLVLKTLDTNDEIENNKILTQLRYNYERLLFKHHIHEYDDKDTYINKVAYYDKSVAKQLSINWTKDQT